MQEVDDSGIISGDLDSIPGEDFNAKDQKALEELNSSNVLSREEIQTIVSGLDKPVNSMKEITAKVKRYIDYRMADELRMEGALSNNTRRWVEVYRALLFDLNKALYGEKSININLTKVSHAQLGSLMREADKTVVDAEFSAGKEKKDEAG